MATKANIKRKVAAATVKGSKSNRDWTQAHTELLEAREKIKQKNTEFKEDIKRLKMEAYTAIYELYLGCDAGALKELAKREELGFAKDKRTKFWNSLVKKVGASKSKASRVVRTFWYAKRKKANPLRFSDFVEKQGGFEACATKYNNEYGEGDNDRPARRRKRLKLIGKSEILSAIVTLEGEFTARVRWEPAQNAVKLLEIETKKSPKTKSSAAEPSNKEEDW